MRKGLPMLARDLQASLGQHPGMGLQGKSAGGAIPSVFPQWEQSWQHDWVIRWINNVFSTVPHTQWGFPGGSIVKNPPAVQEMCQIPGSERSLGGINGNPLQYSYLEKPMDRRA